ERREDASGVEPTDTELSEDVLPVDVPHAQLGGGTVTPVGAADGAANPEAPLGKVQPVAHGAPDAVGRHPPDQGRIHPSLKHQILEQEAHLVANDGGDHRRPLTEATPQTTGHVVLAAAFPHPELAGGADPALARIEAQ